MNRLTIALEYTDKDHPLIKSIMDNMMNNVVEDTEDSVKVYAMAREDLFDKIERLEEVLEDSDLTNTDKYYFIEEIINGQS
jgi:hypothetical protein